VSRNGAVPHDGYEFLHSQHMYDLVHWPGKRAFVRNMVFGITFSGLFAIPGVMYVANLGGMEH